LDDQVYWVLGFLIAAFAVADLAFNSGGAIVFLARKTMDLVSYLAFWRH
jgi:hypothetical protein